MLCANLRGGGDHRVEQAGQVLPLLEPHLVAHVGHHGAHQRQEGAGAEPHRHHAGDGRQVIRPGVGRMDARDRHQDGLGDRVEDAGDLHRAVLAEPLRHRAAPEQRASDAGAAVEDQQEADVLDREALGVVEIVDVERPGGAGAERQQQVGEDQPPHRGPGDGLAVVRQLEDWPVRPRRDLLGREHRADEERDRQGDEHHGGQDRHAGLQSGGDLAVGELRQRQDDGGGDHRHAGGPGVEPGAVVVGLGEHRRPGGLAQRHHREPGVTHHQPADQVELGDRPGGHQHLVDADHHDRHAQHQPRPVAADRRLGAVHDEGDQRIEEDVDHPHDGDGEADQQEGLRRARLEAVDPQADHVAGQVDAVEQQHHRHRHAHGPESEDGGQRNPGGCSWGRAGRCGRHDRSSQIGGRLRRSGFGED